MKMLRIAALQDGFRRAGIAHSRAPKEHVVDDFTKEQLKALKEEPMLVVVEFDGKPEKPEGEKK